MNVSEYTDKNINREIILTSWAHLDPTAPQGQELQGHKLLAQKKAWKLDLLKPLRQWLDGIQVRDRAFAHQLCRLIPAQCPFEREIKLLGRTLCHIPPLCKLNPLYEEVVALRFRALCFLADECQEDISQYC